MNKNPALAPHQLHEIKNGGVIEQHVLDELRHYLPSQTPLKDFIHHNSLHAFQHMPFYDGIFQAAAIFGYQVTLQLSEYRQLYKTGRITGRALDDVLIRRKIHQQSIIWKKRLLEKKYSPPSDPRVGEIRHQWKLQYKIDLDNRVHPTLFRILAAYLDQGVASWQMPIHPDGFLATIREMENKTFSHIFRNGRARKLLQDPETTIENLLSLIVGHRAFFKQYLFDQQFSHPGWSGMVKAIEQTPKALLDERRITLRELIIFELLLELDALDRALGTRWRPLSRKSMTSPRNLFARHSRTELNEVLSIWQDAFEWSYYDEVLAGIRQAKEQEIALPLTPSFQAFFCIDERECSLRRHLESVDPQCETLGTPGFFGVEFYFQPAMGKFYDKLCPAPLNPSYLIREQGVDTKRGHEMLYNPSTHDLIPGFANSLSLGFYAGWRMIADLFRPKMSPAISNAFAHMNPGSQLTIENRDPSHIENGLQVGFTVREMAMRVEALLRGVGLTDNFAPIVYLVAHGSSSANNPHHGAHDCGACSGRPGSVNSRVMAFMANHKEVRAILENQGIHIPDSTQFVGGLHDTAADEIEFYDTSVLTAENIQLHHQHANSFEHALDLNAKERSRRFASIPAGASLPKARKAIAERPVSMFEPRPELGHGTNALCIVGRRELTRSLFLDRRAFLNSYDYEKDPDGHFLAGIMKPLGPVCGGINLEYYFSRVDNHKLGAGTKLPHSVVGLIGVANSSDGDLRPGLPLQMIEVHDPVRLMIIVEHFPEVVLDVIKSSPAMYEWYANEWIHLVAMDPITDEFHYFHKGEFTHYQPATDGVQTYRHFEELLDKSVRMKTNNIVDATTENLAVHVINQS